ncbi:MAG: redox-regulated ATPase YchF [Firmicutes bacterium]|nr:redox-regulated ATPase YchF [Bacillota bacterium]
MSLSIGIVGLPNVGKSTLFNAITAAGADAANYPFCTIEPNVGVVDVPDLRLQVLADMVHPERIVPASVKFVDIAGLVRGASKGEGLGNKFLAHIREVDAIAHVVRCFVDSDVTHVEGGIDPLRDIETINLELILADLETVDRRYDRSQKAAKSGDAKAAAEATLLGRLRQAFDQSLPARSLTYNDEEQAMLRHLHLLTAKPVVYVANVAEDELVGAADLPRVKQVAGYAAGEGSEWLPISARIEAEVAELPPEERAAFLADLGLEESGLNRLIRTGFRLLGLMTFFTAGAPEVRAWTIRRGTKAPQAAGEIHTDFERGFIRAEVVSYNDLTAAGSQPGARDKGLMRLEGKDYVMQDGDVVHFRFNV